MELNDVAMTHSWEFVDYEPNNIHICEAQFGDYVVYYVADDDFVCSFEGCRHSPTLSAGTFTRKNFGTCLRGSLNKETKLNRSIRYGTCAEKLAEIVKVEFLSSHPCFLKREQGGSLWYASNNSKCPSSDQFPSNILLHRALLKHEQPPFNEVVIFLGLIKVKQYRRVDCFHRSVFLSVDDLLQLSRAEEHSGDFLE